VKAPAKKSRKRALGRDAIIDAALAEIDAHGVASFTLRNLADRLGVYPTAIYWYVPTKDHILAEVVGEVFRNVAPKWNGQDWRAYLEDFFARYRTSISQHPNVTPLIGAHLIGNLSIPFDFVEGVLSALTKAGLSGARLAAGYNGVIASLIGFVAQEFSPIPDHEGGDAWQAATQARLLTVDPESHPVLAANLPLLANKAFILRWQNGTVAPLDASFTLFVEQVIAGIERLVSLEPEPRAP